MKQRISLLVLALLASGLSLTAQNRGNGFPVGDGAKMGGSKVGMIKELNLTEDQRAKLKVMHEGFAAQDSVSKVQMMKQREGIRAERELALAKILTPEQLAQMDKLRVEKGQKGQGRGQMGQGQMMGQGRVQMGQGQMMGQGRGQMGQGQMGQGQMMGRGRMMSQGRGQMGQMNRGGAQMREGRPAISKKDAKAFQKQAKRMHKAPMVNPEVRIKNQVERMTKQLDLTPEQASQIQSIQTKHFKKDIAKYRKFEKKRDAQMKKRHGNLDEIKAVLTPEQVKKLDALKEQAPKMGQRNGRMNGPKN